MFKILLTFLLLYSSLYAEGGTEIDKAFIVRKPAEHGIFAVYSTEFYEQRKSLSKAQVFNRDFADGDVKCSGENLSPNMYWKFPPKETKSFALIMQDITNNWYHWVIYNIPPDATEIAMGENKKWFAYPSGTKIVRNDYGDKDYGGPCIKDDKRHTYIITLYALNRELNAIESPAMLLHEVNKYSIKKATIKSYYGENKVIPKIKTNNEPKKVLNKKVDKNNNNKKINIGAMLPSVDTKKIKNNLQKNTQKMKENISKYTDLLKDTISNSTDTLKNKVSNIKGADELKEVEQNNNTNSTNDVSIEQQSIDEKAETEIESVM